MQWVCDICGYVHEEDDPPEICPVCGAPQSKFSENSGDWEETSDEPVVDDIKDDDVEFDETDDDGDSDDDDDDDEDEDGYFEEDDFEDYLDEEDEDR